MSKPILVSGIQPSNRLTLGNYLGAIKQFTKLVNQYQSFIFVADYHAITVPFEPLKLRENSFNSVKLFLACGLDPQQTTLFLQSAIREHIELAYLLMTHSSLGELSRMTQFKTKSQSVKMKNNTNTEPSGLLFYPLLMAADILIYDAKIVPVGDDQKQHLELTRNLAERINQKYQQNIFTIPEITMPEVGQRIMDLQDPMIKMSKSNSQDLGTIFLDEPVESAVTKINRAVTDSFNQIKFDQVNQPGVSNLIQIYCALTEIPINVYVNQMIGKNYGDLKQDVIFAVSKLLNQIQDNYRKISDSAVQQLLIQNAEKCRKIAKKKVDLVHQLFGLQS